MWFNPWGPVKEVFQRHVPFREENVFLKQSLLGLGDLSFTRGHWQGLRHSSALYALMVQVVAFKAHD